MLQPWMNGADITGRSRNMWIIDFPPGMPLEEASLYEAPFEYVSQDMSNQTRIGRTRAGNDLRPKLVATYGTQAPRDCAMPCNQCVLADS